ncbi:hypothetical protein BC938DRAFT_483819, partial [Jimgerdemannia flammicorona]
IAAYITLANSEDLKNPYPVGAELAASLVVGLVGGTTTCWLWRVGTCVVSVLGGFFVGAWILGWRSGGLTQEAGFHTARHRVSSTFRHHTPTHPPSTLSPPQEVGQVAILVIPMVILGILLFFFETNIIVRTPFPPLFSTSFTGAYTLLWSIDRLILHTSFSLGVRVFLNRNGPQPWYTVDWRVYALLGGVALVALLGTIAQGRVDVAGEVEDGNGDMNLLTAMQESCEDKVLLLGWYSSVNGGAIVGDGDV